MCTCVLLLKSWIVWKFSFQVTYINWWHINFKIWHLYSFIYFSFFFCSVQFFVLLRKQIRIETHLPTMQVNTYNLRWQNTTVHVLGSGIRTCRCNTEQIHWIFVKKNTDTLFLSWYHYDLDTFGLEVKKINITFRISECLDCPVSVLRLHNVQV